MKHRPIWKPTSRLHPTHPLRQSIGAPIKPTTNDERDVLMRLRRRRTS